MTRGPRAEAHEGSLRSDRRALSLRARVAAAAALGATIIAVTLGVFVSRAIEHNNLQQTDRQLQTASRLVLFNADIAVRILTLLGRTNDVALTVRVDGEVSASTSVVLPAQPDGSHTVEVDAVPYRVLTTTLAGNPGQAVSLGLPASDAAERTAEQRRWVIGAGVLAITAAGGLGWVFGGRAVRPIVELTHRVGARPPRPVHGVSGVREAEELAGAVNAMLQRVTEAQAETAAALDTARDFAAASAHELRTPLTAMRTDIEVLRTLELDDAQRVEILDDLQRAQGRVEATLSALERLASGELSSQRDHVDTDLVELCDLAAEDAMRHHPGFAVRVDSEPPLIVRGLPAGLRLAVDNALSNAARHGQARTAVVSARRKPDGRIVIAVDDDGAGIPVAEREAVFERFVRGAHAAKGGSGLGLALVAQQAQLHGGRAWFEDGSLGGVRLVMELACR